jgi:glycosyltransferase involved in cell wall biosynthesis
MRRFRETILRRAAFTVAQTPQAGKELSELVPGLAPVVVSNPVELPDPAPLTGDPCVLFTGRLSREKGLAGLLQAWKLVLEAVPGARLSLAGVGGAYRSVERELRSTVAEDPALAASVSFLGWVAETDPLLRAHDVFVLPSHTEGLSNALLEGIAQGRVVVASNIAPNMYVLGDDFPLLYEVGDAAALARALIDALTNDALRQEARARALQNAARFSLETVLDRCEELIDDAARSPRN